MLTNRIFQKQNESLHELVKEFDMQRKAQKSAYVTPANLN